MKNNKCPQCNHYYEDYKDGFCRIDGKCSFMQRIIVPKNFDVNVTEIMKDELDSHIKTGPNIIGSSSIAMCMRKNIISHLISVKFIPNSKMLFGMIFEDTVYLPKVLSSIIVDINDQLGLKSDDIIIKTQAQAMLEVYPGYFFRITPDIYTNKYMVEVKTTGVYKNIWKRELSTHQIVQLNAQLGAFGIDQGFILKMNSRAFLSDIKIDEDYWLKLWEAYGYILPWRFSPELYDETIKRVVYIAKHVEANNFDDVEGPEFGWECRYCNIEVRKICGKEEYICSAPKCYKKIHDFPEKLTRKFKDFPFCINCFKKNNPRSNYDKYKLKYYK